MPTNTYTGDIDIVHGQDSTARQHREGPVARAIEKGTAKLPSDLFLWAAGGAALISLAAQCSASDNAHHKSLFIGEWVPTLLILGLYNKLVKLQGSDRFERQGR